LRMDETKIVDVLCFIETADERDMVTITAHVDVRNRALTERK